MRGIKKVAKQVNMSHDEQMRYLISLADKGLLPPCPKEIRRKYAPKQ
jgi:predicted transcriptional regulator